MSAETGGSDKKGTMHPNSVVLPKCRRCGSSKVKGFAAELAFTVGKSEAVYALARPTVCLECGFSEAFVPHGALNQLKASAAQASEGDSDRATTN